MSSQPGHWTFRLLTNVVLLVLWAALIAVAWRMSPVPPLGFFAAGVVFGALGGTLQYLALSRASRDFARATSALEVRRIFRNTTPGKIYLVVFWGFSVGVVLIPLLRIAYLGPTAMLGPLSAMATFKLVREAITFIPAAKLTKLR